MPINWFTNEVLSWVERIFQLIFINGWDTWKYTPLYWLVAAGVYVSVMILQHKLRTDKESATESQKSSTTETTTETTEVNSTTIKSTNELVKSLLSEILPGFLFAFWLSPILVWLGYRLLVKAAGAYHEIYRKLGKTGRIVGNICVILIGLIMAGLTGVSTWVWARYSWSLGLPFMIGLGLICIELAIRWVLRISKSGLLQNFSPLKGSNFKNSKIMQGGGLLILIILTSAFFMGFFLPVKIHPVEDQTGLPPIDLKIMTYNIRYSGAAESDPLNNWDNRRDELAGYIETLDVDIFGVQESQLPQITYIIQSVSNRKYCFFGVGRNDGVYGGELTAIIYDSERFTLVEGDDFWLSPTPSIPSKQWDEENYRICTWARLREITTDREFYVFNTHLSTKNVTDAGNVHLMSVALLHERILTYSSSLPVLLMGDFNLENTSLAYGELLSYSEKPLQDAYRIANENEAGGIPWDHTFNYFDTSRIHTKSRIDFIFVSGGISVDQCWIPKDVYDGTRPYSDHYPVLLTATIS